MSYAVFMDQLFCPDLLKKGLLGLIDRTNEGLREQREVAINVSESLLWSFGLYGLMVFSSLNNLSGPLSPP